jgi:hypothetical protein
METISTKVQYFIKLVYLTRGLPGNPIVAMLKVHVSEFEVNPTQKTRGSTLNTVILFSQHSKKSMQIEKITKSCMLMLSISV